MTINYAASRSPQQNFEFNLQDFADQQKSLPLHNQVVNVKKFMDGRHLEMYVPKTFRSVCTFQLKGNCKRAFSCPFAHTTALKIAAHLMENPAYKLRKCDRGASCPFGPDECDYGHDWDPKFRQETEHTIDVPTTQKKSKQSKPKSTTPPVAASRFDVLANLSDEVDANENQQTEEAEPFQGGGAGSASQPSKELVPLDSSFLDIDPNLLGALEETVLSDEVDSNENQESAPKETDEPEENAEPHPSDLFHWLGSDFSEMLGISDPQPSPAGGAGSASHLPLVETTTLQDIANLDRQSGLSLKEQLAEADQNPQAFYAKIQEIQNTFAHCTEELPHPSYKANLCSRVFWSKIKCPFENTCNFAHNVITACARRETLFGTQPPKMFNNAFAKEILRPAQWHAR